MDQSLRDADQAQKKRNTCNVLRLINAGTFTRNETNKQKKFFSG